MKEIKEMNNVQEFKGSAELPAETKQIIRSIQELDIRLTALEYRVERMREVLEKEEK